MQREKVQNLPILEVIEQVQQALASHSRLVLQAPPGAGKTTVVPLALLDEPWLAGRKIIVLTPRRLAARAAACRMAELLGEQVGQTIGYRVRLDTRVSRATRVEVVTEGVLTRRLQRDPGLDGVGLVIFDEFHERHLEADLGLALCLDLQGVLNPELRLLLMSATLEGERMAAMLDGSPVITCRGRMYPVTTSYLGQQHPQADWRLVARTIGRLVAQDEGRGSILVFLPGTGAIRQVADLLAESQLPDNWRLLPLHGSLLAEQQDLALRQPAPGWRHIILATNVAETSLTIEGVEVVVDSGLEKRLRFDPKNAMARLQLQSISKASADQRRGRAGRNGPGRCLRLWSEAAHQGLVVAGRPEILEADLSGLLLEVALWGAGSPAELTWLDPPPAAAVQRGRELLVRLGALDQQGRVLPHGRLMAELPLHPRLAHLLLRGYELAAGRQACRLAALLMERDFLQFDHHHGQCDLQLRLDLLAERGRAVPPPGARINSGLLQRVRTVACDLEQRLKIRHADAAGETSEEVAGRLLALGFPDRIARQREGRPGSFQLAEGGGAWLEQGDLLARQEYLVASELDGSRTRARIYLAASYRLDWLRQDFAPAIHWRQTVVWDEQREQLVARREELFGALVLGAEPWLEPEPQLLVEGLLQVIRARGLDCLPWTRTVEQWRHRVSFLFRLQAGSLPWPDLSSERLLADLEIWLAPFLVGCRSLRDLAQIDLGSALRSLLPPGLAGELERWAPSHYQAPSGSRLPLDYREEVPVLAVRLQELFSLASTPTVAMGRQPLLLHLLSPASRPLQITSDLAGFWQGSYRQVRSEMLGRYPKHHWPEDPLAAQPTSRAKPRK